MTPDEAIKWSKDISEWLNKNFMKHPFMTSEVLAIQLGIEALERVISQRLPNFPSVFPLPSETKESS